MTPSTTISPTTERVLIGIPASAGIAIATASVRAVQFGSLSQSHAIDETNVESEIARFRASIVKAEAMISRSESLAQDDLMSPSDIFEALRMMLHDPTLTGGVEHAITDERMTAAAAITSQMNKLADIFGASPDPTLQSRAEDIRALETHLLMGLSDGTHSPHVGNQNVLVLQSLSPLDVVEYARENVPGLIPETGGINSHAAILARSFGIPMVAGVDGACLHVQSGELVIVDGYIGRVIINPNTETLESYRAKKHEIDVQRTATRALRDLPAETRDGLRITLAANIDVVDEIDMAIENGARKVGLLRSEFSAPYRLDLFTVEEQTELYRSIAERAFPMTVTMRAFDVGGDKPFSVGESSDEKSTESPLGLRGVRFLLKHHQILRTQIEAMFRASAMKNLRLMIPMVSSVDEMRQVLKIVQEVRQDLTSKGVWYDEHLGVGAMIETPAAALSAISIAKECGFLSIGTNDLTQYTLAVDRADPAVAQYYDELHPSVLQMIHIAVVAAERANLPITICGELAANPLATTVLIGLGLYRFSVSPSHLPELKRRILAIDSTEAHNLARRVLRMGSPVEVRELLQQDAEKNL